MAAEEAFVLGLDLDGCVANFIGRTRDITLSGPARTK